MKLNMQGNNPEPATQNQQDYLAILQDRMRRLYGTDTIFYDLVQKVSGQRTTSRLSKAEVSLLIEKIKFEHLD